METPAQNAVAIGGIIVLAAAIHLAGARIAERAAQPSVAVESFDMPEELGEPASGAGVPIIAPSPSDPKVQTGEPLPEPPATDAVIEPEAAEAGVPEGYAPKLLFQPAATASGRFQAQGYKITLAGVQPVEIEEICGEGRKNRWPCGAMARTQFRNFLRGRALSCVVPDPAPFEMIEAECTVGGEDASAWLVTHGWARAGADGALSQASAAAQSAGLGIWGSRPQNP